MASKTCLYCGAAFSTDTNALTCSEQCRVNRKNYTRRTWAHRDVERERERLREYERRRTRSEEQKEKRRVASREKYRKMRAAYVAVKDLIGE